MIHKYTRIVLSALCLVSIVSAPALAQKAHGWLSWRGPQQTGTSLETNLPDQWQLGGVNDLWSLDLSGRGTPVIANGRAYIWGYRGEKDQLVEVFMAVDAETGEKIWEHEFADFLSDVIYDRYAIGAPAVDAETGNIYLMTTPGLMMCFGADGEILWQYSMGEEFGRSTYPNGRTGTVSIEDDLAIVRAISKNWGSMGPPRDRFYAFDKKSGDIVWTATPGAGPPYLKDSCFATPYFDDYEGKRVFYTGVGSGSVVCVNARTGESMWRNQMIVGGINSSVLVHNGRVIVTHGLKNLESSETGGMSAINIPKNLDTSNGQVMLDRNAVQAWRNPITMFTSSPVLVGDLIYQVDKVGVLNCVDANTGEILWHQKLAPDQIHASPTWADGKLYVPMNDGSFHILKVSREGAQSLSVTQLDGNCLGAPAIWNGKVYVFTNKRFYCFGTKGDSKHTPGPVAHKKPAVGPAAALQILPHDVVIRPGEKRSFKVRSIDKNGHVVGPVTDATFASFVPPTARVKAELDASFQGATLVARADSKASAGAFMATSGDLKGTIRARILPPLNYSEDFEGFDVATPHAKEVGVNFAYPPLPWIGARFNWEIRELDGSNVLAKTIDNLILMRSITFIGHPDSSDYTMQADIMTDGSRRGASEVGLIHQRYFIVLKGNHDQIEVNSNQERLKVATRFPVSTKTWYTMKSRVDRNADGTGVIRVKCWKRGEAEPADWLLEVPHHITHEKGAPGVFGFAPQNKYRVYVDNIKITPNN
ncbi:MAG: outer membrane protein assembly factor BamB family protein [Planctomycetota bacterium]